MKLLYVGELSKANFVGAISNRLLLEAYESKFVYESVSAHLGLPEVQGLVLVGNQNLVFLETESYQVLLSVARDKDGGIVAVLRQSEELPFESPGVYIVNTHEKTVRVIAKELDRFFNGRLNRKEDRPLD